jgi:anti-sigma-K factor RskA
VSRFRVRRTDPHTLAGAYALDALGGADRARFERHLSGCPSCAQEARGLQEATSRLADTLATAPPDGMRERVLAAAARTRQNPPVTEPARAPWPARVGLRGQAASRGWGARGRRWGILVAGGALAIALALGGLAFHTEQQLNQMRNRSRAIAAVLNEPDAAMMTVAATTRGSATIVMSHRAGALVFTAARLPALPSSQRYELWLMGRDGPRAAGILPPPRSGMTAPVIVSGLRSGDEFAVSAEPAGGTRHPTSRMIMQVALSS